MRNFHRLAQNMDFTQLVHSIRRQPALWDFEFPDLIKLRYLDQYGELIWFPSAMRLPVKPLLFDLMRTVEGERLGGVVVGRHPPGGVASCGPVVESSWTHYKVILWAGPGVEFCSGSEKVQFRTGDVWYHDAGESTQLCNYSSDDALVMGVEIEHS